MPILCDFARAFPCNWDKGERGPTVVVQEAIVSCKLTLIDDNDRCPCMGKEQFLCYSLASTEG